MAHRTAKSSACRELRTSRRALLAAGGAALFGMGLPQLLAAQAERGRTAKRCILIFQWGGPSHLDTFDLKPDAPAEVRGTFNPIATSVPGVQICEHFQKLAPLMDRCALIRSLTHDDPAHLSSGHLALTGNLAPKLKSDADPPSDADTPHIGAVLAKLHQDGVFSGASRELPASVVLPWKCYHPAAPGGQAPGQHGGWLGKRFDPMLLQGDLNAADWRIPELTLTADVNADRLAGRRGLLSTIDRQREALADTAAAKAVSGFQEQAFSLLAGESAREAFDLTKEPEAMRERYGRNLHGQCVLLARRLVERGVPVVNVNWHNDGKNFWDTHGDNFNRLKNELIPPSDQALAALLSDLEERGLLKDTLVAWFGEFGRKPQITAANAGREHWPFCFSALLAGGGIRGGSVYGASDKIAAYPSENPVSPQDYAATIFQAMGVSPDYQLFDQTNRPHPVCRGNPLVELFG